jgi:hypothetical protein
VDSRSNTSGTTGRTRQATPLRSVPTATTVTKRRNRSPLPRLLANRLSRRNPNRRDGVRPCVSRRRLWSAAAPARLDPHRRSLLPSSRSNQPRRRHPSNHRLRPPNPPRPGAPAGGQSACLETGGDATGASLNLSPLAGRGRNLRSSRKFRVRGPLRRL